MTSKIPRSRPSARRSSTSTALGSAPTLIMPAAEGARPAEVPAPDPAPPSPLFSSAGAGTPPSRDSVVHQGRVEEGISRLLNEAGLACPPARV